MCLVTLDPKPKVAEEDIPVRKVLEKGNTGFYRCYYTYKHGHNYPEPDPCDEDSGVTKQNYDDTYEVRGGWLHAIKRTGNKRVMLKHFNAKWGVWKSARWSRVVKMYIPKGTEYYEDKNGRYICAKCLVWPWISFK